MVKRNKIKIGCGIIILIACIFLVVLIAHLYWDLSKLEKAYNAIEHSSSVEFNTIGQTIFITTRQWGLGGQHFHTIISNVDHANNNISTNEEKEIVLNGICGFYYKALDPDSLLVFFSSGSYSEDEIIYREIGNIKVKITKYKATMNNYYKDYKELGLSRISCYPN